MMAEQQRVSACCDPHAPKTLYDIYPNRGRPSFCHWGNLVIKMHSGQVRVLISSCAKEIKRCAVAVGGAAAVEFVLILPIILALIVPCIDFASVVLEKQNISSIINSSLGIVSAAEGRDINDEEIVAEIRNKFSENGRELLISLERQCVCLNEGIECQGECLNGTKSKVLELTIAYNVDLMFPYPGIGDSYRIEKNITYRLK
jgi:hypothetical protein